MAKERKYILQIRLSQTEGRSSRVLHLPVEKKAHNFYGHKRHKRLVDTTPKIHKKTSTIPQRRYLGASDPQTLEAQLTTLSCGRLIHKGPALYLSKRDKKTEEPTNPRKAPSR